MENERALSREQHAHSTYGVPTSLNLGRKVFLSHSGRDKDFVRFLHKQLCDLYPDTITFFDAETLPKAEAISMENILEEARGSELGVLVLTEHFFTHTQNPMLELDAFVTGQVKLLPLFFTISVDQFKEKRRRARWEKQWRKWSAVDKGVINAWWKKQWRKWSAVDKGVINAWRDALDLVSTFSGLEYCKIATNHSDYVDKIVKEVARIIGPAISFSEEGVCGKDRLCKIVNVMYEACAMLRSSNDRTQIASTSARPGVGEVSGHPLEVVGIYGFPGLGKTTLCKCLCDSYFAEFNGKVCYVDLGSPPSVQAMPNSSSAIYLRMQHILSMLTGGNNDSQHSLLYLSQVQNLLRKQFSSMKDPVFLAIDNILPERESQEEALFYLRCKFPKGSKIFITSRSKSILENLTSLCSSILVVIEYMPALDLKEARDIFVHEFPQLCGDVLEKEVEECVNMCTIRWCSSEWWDSYRYHPLMLKSLAASIRWDRTRNLDWKERLAKLRSEGIVDKHDAWKTVFKMLDITYALLSEESKKVFMDLALFYNATRKHYAMYEWIERVYSHLDKKKMSVIFLELQDLCFIQGQSKEPLEFWSLHSGGWCFIQKSQTLKPLDGLLLDFCKYRVSKGANPQYYVVDGIHWPDDLPMSVRHVSISRYDTKVRRLDLRNMEGVEVLHLVDNSGLQEVLLSHSTCAHLRSLIVRVPANTSLRLKLDEEWSSTAASTSAAVGQVEHDGGCLGMRLQWVDLEGNICFKSERSSLMLRNNYEFSNSLSKLEITAAPVTMDLGSILGHLRNLEFLTLSDLPTVQSINVTNYSCNLKHLQLYNLPSLSDISGLDKSKNLAALVIRTCNKLGTLTMPVDTETYSEIYGCTSLERISLCTTSLPCPAGADSSCRRRRNGCLQIEDCGSVRNIDGLSEYTGSFSYQVIWFLEPGFMGAPSIEAFGKLLEDAGIDSSICKARVHTDFKLTGYPAMGLAGAQKIGLKDAQHIGLLISALFKAQPKDLRSLTVFCKQDGDCGCDKNAPHFGSLPEPTHEHGFHDYFKYPEFSYRCRQVTDLGGLAQWNVLQDLSLVGCTSVEVWPDFKAMTLLQILDLSYTSLREWPTGVESLHDLKRFGIRGCRQLSPEKLIKVLVKLIKVVTLGTHGNVMCILYSLGSLRDDVKMGRRDRCSVADALDSLYPELVALFHQAALSETMQFCWSTAVLQFLIQIMYEMWFEDTNSVWIGFCPLDKGVDGQWHTTDCGGLPHIWTKLRRLLCSESFLSLPFRARWTESLVSLPVTDSSWNHVRPYRLYTNPKDHESVSVECSMMALIGLMGIALVGTASIAWYNAPVNDDLRDSIIIFLKSFTQETVYGAFRSTRLPCIQWSPILVDLLFYRLSEGETKLLKMRVGEAVCRMAWVPSVAAELGEDFLHTIIQRVQAWVHHDCADFVNSQNSLDNYYKFWLF